LKEVKARKEEVGRLCRRREGGWLGWRTGAESEVKKSGTGLERQSSGYEGRWGQRHHWNPERGKAEGAAIVEWGNTILEKKSGGRGRTFETLAQQSLWHVIIA